MRLDRTTSSFLGVFLLLDHMIILVIIQKTNYKKTLIGREHSVNKQLLDEVFVISRIIKVEVGVISRSRRGNVSFRRLFKNCITKQLSNSASP